MAGGGGAGGVGAGGGGEELGIGSIQPEPDHPISISWNTAMLCLRGSGAARPASRRGRRESAWDDSRIYLAQL
jgi:hypothetical protein